MKKVLLLLLAVLTTTMAMAQTTITVGGLKYSVSGTTATVTGYQTSPSGTLTIPSTVNDGTTDYSVTAIGQKAFYSCNGLNGVTIPNSVTSIGKEAFAGSAIRSVSISSSVTTIGDMAYKNCKRLKSVYYDAINISQIGSTGNWVFGGCDSLETVVVGPHVVRIPKFAFNTGLNNISFLTSVDFSNATSLQSIGASAFRMTKLSSVEIPNSVTSIEGCAFQGCSLLENLSLGTSVTTIGEYAFAQTRISELTIPASVTTITQLAFQACTNLTTVYFNATNCTTCGNSTNKAFSGCTAVEHLYIGPQVTNIPAAAFFGFGTNILSTIIPSSVTDIGNYAFEGCSNLTIYDLTTINNFTRISKGTVKRVVKCSNHGTGSNVLHKMNENYSVANGDDNSVETTIPKSLVPDNFIYSNDNGTTWLAKKIVLTDDSCRFNTPVAFTAELAEYTRTLTDGNRSTLCLPFTTTIPANLEVYTFTGYSNGTLYFNTLGGNTISAYTPYLIGKGLTKDQSTFTFTQANAYFPQTSEATPTYTTNQNGMTFQGVVKRTCMNNTCYGYKDGFFVQSSQGSNYNSVHTDHAHVNPFRCYFTTGTPVGMTLDVVTDGDNLGIDEVDTDAAVETSIRYSTDVYDMMGRLVRRNADNLQGLPKGIYIWKGKKVLAY